MDHQSLLNKIIDYSQRPETLSVKQIVRHETPTPAMINMGQNLTLLAMYCTDIHAGAFSAQTQSVLRFSGFFHSNVSLFDMEERPETSV
ncbi:hypothetical protein TH60_21610 [Pantoea ananatis]|jgi:hypothetical protein|nr:hypothetical protein [Pantoea ananatis]